MKRWFLVGLALAAVVAACTDAPFVGDGTVVRGRILMQDGRRAPERTVVVVEAPSGVDPEGFGVLGSVGLACVDAGKQCRGTRQTAVTDEGGRFAVEFDETPAAVEVAAGLRAAPGLLAGPTVSQRTALDGDETLVPDVRVWEPSLTLSAEGAGGAVGWPALVEPDLGRAVVYRVVFELATGEPVWVIDVPAPPAPIDLRLLEDSSGAASVVVFAGAQQAEQTLLLGYRSGLVPYKSRAAPPLSRGADCRAESRAGEVVEQHPCGLTDGDLASPFRPRAQARHRLAEIDLGQTVPVSLIVVRGCNSACAVEVSVDGAAWAPAGPAGVDLAAVPLPDTPARFVRIVSPLSVDEVREVSVWSGPTGLTGEPGFAQIPPFQVPGVADPALPDDSSTTEEKLLVALIAGVLAFSVLAAILDYYGRSRALHR